MDEEAKKPKNMKKELFKSTIQGFAVGVATFALLRMFIVPAYVVGSSMAGTLVDGQYTLGIRTAFAGELERGDIITFYPPDEMTGAYKDRLFVKRIIGLPGETVRIEDGVVYIDGEVLEEDYIDSWTKNTGPYEFTVPEGSYFVMGDNRDNSYDSRNWDTPYVPYENILSKAELAYKGRMLRYLYTEEQENKDNG